MNIRMRPFWPCLIIVSFILSGLPEAWPVAPALAEEGPVIAVLDVERILRVSQAAKSLREEVDKKRSVYQAELRKQEEALRAADQELARQRAILSTEAFAAKRQELQQQAAKLQRDFLTRQKDLEQIFGQGMTQVRRALLGVATDIVKDRKIDVLLLKAAVVLVNIKLDITEEVLEGLNAELPSVAAPAAQN